MKLRASLKYQLFSYLSPLATFYGVVILLNAFAAAMTLTFNGNSVSLAGNDIASLIFAFVLGLNSVKESFKLMAANGRTRRTAFSSIALGSLIAAACMAVVDMLTEPVFAPFFERYGTLYDLLYGGAKGFGGILVEYAWRVALYGVAALTGVWVSALYYRMNKGFKIGVSVGVPVLLFFVLPVVEANYTHGKIIEAVAYAIKYMFGFGGAAPQPAMFCLWGMLLLFAAAGVFWACLRRAPVKD